MITDPVLCPWVHKMCVILLRRWPSCPLSSMMASGIISASPGPPGTGSGKPTRTVPRAATGRTWRPIILSSHRECWCWARSRYCRGPGGGLLQGKKRWEGREERGGGEGSAFPWEAAQGSSCTALGQVPALRGLVGKRRLPRLGAPLLVAAARLSWSWEGWSCL